MSKLDDLRQQIDEPCANCAHPNDREALRLMGYGDNGCPECHGTQRNPGPFLTRSEAVLLIKEETAKEGVEKMPEGWRKRAAKLNSLVGLQAGVGRSPFVANVTIEYPHENRPRQLVPNFTLTFNNGVKICGQLGMVQG